MREKKDIRIFFALWPNDAIRRQLHTITSGIPLSRPARAVPIYNLHLTLHFIGNVFSDQMDCLRRQARTVSTEGFEISIDCSGHFGKPKVAWLGCRNISPALQILKQKLGTALGDCDYQPETRQYHPHITVARKFSRQAALQAFEPIRWSIDQFALIESRSTFKGVEYGVVESFPLQ